MGKKGGAINFKKPDTDHCHLLDKILGHVKTSEKEYPLWLYDYEWLGKNCSPRLMSLYNLRSLIAAMIDAAPALAIRYADLKLVLQNIKEKLMKTALHKRTDMVVHVADKLMTVQKHMRELAWAPHKIDEADLSRFASNALKDLIGNMVLLPKEGSTSPSTSPLSTPRRSNSEKSLTCSLLSIKDTVDPEEQEPSQSSDISLDSDGFPDFNEMNLLAMKKRVVPPTKKALHEAFGHEKGKKKNQKPGLAKKPAANEKAAKKPASNDKVLKLVKKSKKLPSSSPWKLLHSKIYSRERQKRFLEHGDDEKAKKQASKACAAAKIKWDKGELEGF